MSKAKEGKPRRIDTRQTPEYKRQIKIGQEIASRLPVLKSAREVAAELGISEQAVRFAEARALYKMQTGLRIALGGETIDNPLPA